MSLYSDLNDVLTPYAQRIKGKADKSTTYTKTEVDALISEVEVETDTTLEVSGAPADAAETGRQIGLINESLDDVKADLVKELLTEDTIPGTTQTVTMTDGKVTQVAHTQGNTTLRTDVFTYSTGSITEVRTLNSGESLTMVTDLATLATSTTYTAS